MTRRDRGIVAALGLVLVALGLIIAAPSSPAAPGGAAGQPANESSSGQPSDVYREGIVGRPSSINPVTARTQADRDLAALIFSGLVALGPDGTYRPDLASSWTVDARATTWTFTIRPDARWQDGEPVTSDDVVFTVEVLQHPDYTGSLAPSWRGVSVSAIDDRTVSFVLESPGAGFLQDATVGLLPAHLLRDTPVDTLADSPFSLQPVGSGPFVLVGWNAESANLVPSTLADTPVEATAQPTASAPISTPVPPSPGLSATPSPAPSATPQTWPAAAPPFKASPTEGLPGIEFRYFPDADALAAAYRAGNLDAASGLPASVAHALVASAGGHLLSYPRTTLTAIAINIRPGNGELRVPRVRRALLEAIDRAAIISSVVDGAAKRADSPIPPSSWAFDRRASRPVAYNLKAAAADLKAAGWRAANGWRAPGFKSRYVIGLIAPDADTNPVVMAVAEAVAASWRTFGFKVNLTGLPASEFVGERLEQGAFKIAAVDVGIGLDPDLYPLFGSTQVGAGGSNISGIQDVRLDRLLRAARAPGTLEQRKGAFAALQKRLVERNYLLPIFYRDWPVVMSDRVLGPTVREVGDPSDRYWDVLNWRLAGDR